MTEKPVRTLRSLSAEELNRLILDIVLEEKEDADPSLHVLVQLANHPDYAEKIINPVSFQDLEKKCSDNRYTNPQELISDMTWIYHNASICNGSDRLTANAEQLLRDAVSRVADMEICPDCFINSSAQPQDWFKEACRKPHVLVMAKVKGQSLISHVVSDLSHSCFRMAGMAGEIDAHRSADKHCASPLFRDIPAVSICVYQLTNLI
jgi:hypothetical protein